MIIAFICSASPTGFLQSVHSHKSLSDPITTIDKLHDPTYSNTPRHWSKCNESLKLEQTLHYILLLQNPFLFQCRCNLVPSLASLQFVGGKHSQSEYIGNLRPCASSRMNCTVGVCKTGRAILWLFTRITTLQNNWMCMSTSYCHNIFCLDALRNIITIYLLHPPLASKTTDPCGKPRSPTTTVCKLDWTQPFWSTFVSEFNSQFVLPHFLLGSLFPGNLVSFDSYWEL